VNTYRRLRRMGMNVSLCAKRNESKKRVLNETVVLAECFDIVPITFVTIKE